MAEEEPQEDDQSARLKHCLLVRLKTTVEGLLASNATNVWSTYGGLGRLCKDVDQILHHRLKFVAGDFGSVNDYWPFVKGLKWLKPEMTPFIEKIRKGSYQKGTSKGQVWVRESLREHNLVLQLKVLVTSEQHLHRHYFEDAFLSNADYFGALCLCLQAVEENQVSLLADLDPKLLNFHPPILKDAPSHIRSASLPLSTTSSSIRCPRVHRASYSDAMALAPPFASPPNREGSFLCTSDEHGVPGSIASSASPDESRMTAREALRDVLRKSGSDMDLSPVGENSDLFSFYDDSINSDPLLNLGFLQGSKSPKDSVSKKPVLTRIASEGVGLKRQFENRRASEMMDKILVEDDDDSFVFSSDNDKSKLTMSDSKEKTDSPKASRVIFSDTEGVESETKQKSVKGKYGKHSHKRSRSDVSGIKMALAQDQTDGGVGKSQTLREPISGKGAQEETDLGNGAFFPQPTKGQSLLNYLSSQDFHTCAYLDKENAHFGICEALIAAIEQMKWNHVISPTGGVEEEEEDSDEEIKQLQQRIRIRKRQRLKEKARGFPVLSDGRTDTTATSSHSQTDSPNSSSYDSDYSDSESSGADDKQIELTMEDGEGNLSRLKNSGLSLSLASMYSDADIQKKTGSVEREMAFQDGSASYFSAESVAISLLRKFSEKQLPKASDLQWLVTEQDAPQRLLPLPNSYPISPDDADKSKLTSGRMRLRGNLEWAPPRAQIIFNIHPAPQRSVLLARQNYKCAGCGMKVETGYAKRYRYCEYLGKYFCKCCHSNHSTYIPARLLQRWDFTKYPVSNFAKENILNKISDEPLFNVADINAMLYKRVKLLDHVKDWRLQLHYLKTLMNMCKQATSLSSEIAKLPSHWIEDTHVYSINDLISIKSGVGGHMYHSLKTVVTDAITHLEGCQFCQCFGFICEMCRDQSDVIFPYQLQKVTVCQGCKTCFHKNCFVPQKCPKCARIEARNKRLQDESVAEEDDKEEVSKEDDS